MSIQSYFKCMGSYPPDVSIYYNKLNKEALLVIDSPHAYSTHLVPHLNFKIILKFRIY